MSILPNSASEDGKQGVQDRPVNNDLDALLTALYVKIDDDLGSDRWMGRPPR